MIDVISVVTYKGGIIKVSGGSDLDTVIKSLEQAIADLKSETLEVADSTIEEE